MPYKDPEKQKEYCRENMRRIRAEKRGEQYPKPAEEERPVYDDYDHEAIRESGPSKLVYLAILIGLAGLVMGIWALLEANKAMDTVRYWFGG